MIGHIKLFVNGKLFYRNVYKSPSHRKELMLKMSQLYGLKNKEHYWEILPPDVVDNGISKVNRRVIHNFNK